MGQAAVVVGIMGLDSARVGTRLEAKRSSNSPAVTGRFEFDAIVPPRLQGLKPQGCHADQGATNAGWQALQTIDGRASAREAAAGNTPGPWRDKSARSIKR